VEGEKMSKSLGNFVTINQLLQDWPGEVIRFNMLRTHYRQPMDWTEAGMRESERTLSQWYELSGAAEAGLLCAATVDALSDDLNTPKAIASLHDLRAEAAQGAEGAKRSLKASAQLLGLLSKTRAEWESTRKASVGVDEARVVDLIAARAAARKAKNF